jgi:hypothetical protein
LENKRNPVYIHPDVAQVRELHAAVLSSFDFSGSITELLELMAHNLFDANESGDPRSQVEIKNYMNPGEFSQLGNMIRIDLQMARELMARQHGFTDWEEVKHGGGVAVQVSFESAVDLLIMGKIEELDKILDENPHLIIQRSAFFHKASLLHYTSANGVEIRRQVVPHNLTDMIRLLLGRGADREARGFFYGSMMDTVSLLQTGTHIREAGVYEEVYKLLT